MAFVSANEILVPLQTEFFALEGITQLVKTIERIKVNLNPSLSVRGILLTMFDKRNKLSSQVDKEARNYFKEKVYQSVIPRNVRLSEAPSHGQPCVTYDKACSGSKAYFKLAQEFKNQNQQDRKRSMNAKKNKGLGKGLSALFGEQKKPENTSQFKGNVQKALVGELARNKYQPRTIFDEAKLAELSKSIKQNGMIQPIAVRKK